MTISEAKRLNVGDRVGCRLYAEDGIILKIDKVNDKNYIFTIAFETYGVVEVKHRDLNMRVLCFCGVRDYFNFEDSLHCPSVLKFGITNISNEELLRLWNMENVYSKYLV